MAEQIKITIKKDGTVDIEGGSTAIEGSGCLIAAQPFIQALNGESYTNPLTDEVEELEQDHLYVTE